MSFRTLAAVLTVAGVVTLAAPAHAWQLTWLGHAGFLIEAKDGTRILVDPWLQNPKFPKGYQWPDRVDAILVTHGHFDHASSAADLSTRFKAPIIGCFELVNQLQPKGGTPGIGGNVGGTVDVKGVRVSMVPAIHSSSLMGPNQETLYAGTPVGFVLQAKGEPTLMHAGDTGLTRDFETIRDVYKPRIGLLPIGGHFTMDPAQAAIAARYLGVQNVVPMHYGTFPLLKGTPAELKEALKGTSIQVHELTPGQKTTL
ncbi:MAG TPA: metal-dependent hydrolase [Stenomitos sp.]